MIACIGFAMACLPAWSRAQTPATQPSATRQFMRLVPDHAGGGKLETAVVTYRNDAGVRVHLVAAVHIADKGYYERLNKTFTRYDALLYELIKPRGANPPAPGSRPTSGIGLLQRGMKDAMKLDFQLDDIDYTKHNFVHADLDAEEFTSMESQRGESILGVMIQQSFHEMERQAQGKSKAHPITIFHLLAALKAPDSARQFKLLMAEQFDTIEDQFAGVGGPQGNVIITERNKRCIQRLQESIAKGNKNIGIFYGAAHMPDMSKRVEELGFKQVNTKWLLSWDMTAGPATQPTSAPTTQPQAVSK